MQRIKVVAILILFQMGLFLDYLSNFSRTSSRGGGESDADADTIPGIVPSAKRKSGSPAKRKKQNGLPKIIWLEVIRNSL